jgi:hypothetical protein
VGGWDGRGNPENPMVKLGIIILVVTLFGLAWRQHWLDDIGRGLKQAVTLFGLFG